MPRLTSLGPELWCATHDFKIGWMKASTRMTVVRLDGKHLWLHSPIPLDNELLSELAQLGEVRAVVAPNKVHHLFLAPCAAIFPNATIYGAPGLAEKRPSLPPMLELTSKPFADWEGHLDQVFIEGIPFANETVWFHHASATLIITDLVQCWDGRLSWPEKMYAMLTGVNARLNVPYTVRALVRDREAFQRSAARILKWPIQRIVMAHNTVIDVDAHARMHCALAPLINS
jgi:Domain of unknown function (DUF4336)